MPPIKSQIEQMLDYCPKTGYFRWKLTKGRCKKGAIAGSLGGYGYIAIGIAGTKYGAHRLAWLLCTGKWPVEDIDHINNIQSDNRFENLRIATRSQNRGNSKSQNGSRSGLKGAAWDSQTKRWRATIMVKGIFHHLGRFDTVEEAHAAYCRASTLLHGEFARHK